MATTGMCAVRSSCPERACGVHCRPCRGAAGRAGSRPAGASARERERAHGRSPPRSSRSPRAPEDVSARASGSSRCRRRSGREVPVRRPSAWRSDVIAVSSAVPIRIVLAEDRVPSSARVFGACSNARADLEVAAVCDDLDSLLDSGRRRAAGRRRHGHPHAAGAHRRGHPGRGRGCARRIPNVGVVVLSQYATPSYALALLEGGSAGRAYLLKERVQDLEQLVSAIHAVAEGGSVIDPKVVEALVAENARGERVAAQPADAARARRAARDGRRQEQRGDRRRRSSWPSGRSRR